MGRVYCEDVSKGKAALGLTWGSEEAIGFPGAIQWLDSCVLLRSGLSRLSLGLQAYVPALPIIEGHLLEEEDAMLMSTLWKCCEWVMLGPFLHTGWVLRIVTDIRPSGQQEEHKATRPRKWRLGSLTQFSQLNSLHDFIFSLS